MLLRIAFFVLLTIALVQAEAFEGDASAVVGDYARADSLYEKEYAGTTDPARKRKLLLRRLGVAQAVNNVVQAHKLGESLEESLEGQDDPEVAMRLYLIRGAIATRTVDELGAQAAFAKARPFAERLAALGDPGGALGLAECNSYAYLAPLLKVGRPEPMQYQGACFQAYQVSLANLPTVQKPLWCLDLTRSTYWTRLWVWRAWEYYFIALQRNDQALTAQWSQASFQIGQTAFQNLIAGHQATQDQEYALAAMQVLLELTLAFPVHPYSVTLLDELEQQLSSLPVNSELYSIKARIARSRARRAVALKNFAEALKEYTTAASQFEVSGHKVDQMDIWVETAYVHLLSGADGEGWGAAVEANLKQLLATSEKVSYPFGRYFGLGFLGALKSRQNDLKASEAYLRQALEQMKDWSQGETPVARVQKFQRPEVKLFSDTLVDVLLRQDRQSEAMETVRQMGALVESAGLDLGQVKASDPKTNERLRSIEEGKRERVQLTARLQSAQMEGDTASAQVLTQELARSKAQFHATINTVRREDPNFERMLSVRPSSFSKLQASLPTDVVLVSYYSSESKTILFAATREELQVFSTSLGREELDGLVSGLRKSLTSQSSLDPRALSRLHAALIGPIEPLLEKRSVLTVIPSGKLYYLPFAILKDANGRALGERVGIAFLTATELPDLADYGTDSGVKPSRLLALANPDGTLPGANSEVEGLATLFAERTVYFGKDATAERLSGAKDVVHLATHGVLDSRDVNESYLVVSGPGQRLSLGDIYGLDFKDVSLVTLSACETALGEINPGAEIATLAQAFSVAGSRSMLGSLWRVEDQATAFLMKRFYTHLLSGKSKVESLRLAQEDVRADSRWTHPFYWAAFTLIGDWN